MSSSGYWDIKVSAATASLANPLTDGSPAGYEIKKDKSSGTTWGNTVTVTDPAGKWKTFAMDAFGNLTSVTEPNPSGQGSGDPSASFVRSDTATQGNWHGVLGADGYAVIGDQTANPSYVTPAASEQLFYNWAPSTSDVRALQKASNFSAESRGHGTCSVIRSQGRWRGSGCGWRRRSARPIRRAI